MRKLSWLLITVYFAVQLLLQPTRGENGTEISKCPSSQFTCKNEKCIPPGWHCDKDNDCEDGSDETDCPGSTTCAHDQYQCDNGKCISERWFCDRDDDCHDGSDEDPKKCENKTCKEDQFTCKNGACIPKEWVCDGQTDCADDGFDEATENCEKTTCKPGEYQCQNGRCITETWACDGDDDCLDGSDETEAKCPVKVCDEEEFQCDNLMCVKKSWLCDGDVDCSDGSDENTEHCNGTTTEPNCSATEFACKEGDECIHMSWKCDGDADCADSSDEQPIESCVLTCRPDQFMCEKDSYCIHDIMRCDGNEDCNDASDEKNCPAKCLDDEFDCFKNGSLCIDLKKVCDKSNDCGNFEDEDADLKCPDDPCKPNGGDCSQVCVNLYRGNHRCECHEGYKLAEGSETMCVDIDECLIEGSCSQICKNTKGSYKCECIDGYTLSDKKHCRADGEDAELILANRKDLRRINIENQKSSAYTLLVKNASVDCAIAVDYNIRKMKVYWTDVKLEQILSADIDGDKSHQVVIAKDLVSTPDGIAVDWIHDHLYWTDTGYDKIEVSSLDGSMRKVLINTGLEAPRAIALDPKNGYMYWTDWGSDPKIEKCGMDGSNRRTIIDKKTTRISWPNGITIDYVSERLYWIDAKEHKIASSDFEGQKIRLVHSSHVSIHHPFGITVFEDFIYWTEWRSESVLKMNKFGTDQPSSVAIDLNEPMDVHIFHKYRQQESPNRCGENNGGCSHFCLPRPKSDQKSALFSCVCPDDFEMDFNEKTCTEKAHKTKVPDPVENHIEEDSPNKSKHRKWVSVKPGVSVKPSVVTDAPKTTAEPQVEVTDIHIPHEVTSDSGYDIATFNSSVNLPVNKEPKENTGTVAIIVVAAIGALAIIVAIVAFVVCRRVRKKNVKSMNFDNPVYRKTTEDQFQIDKNLPPSMQPLNPPNNELV